MMIVAPQPLQTLEQLIDALPIGAAVVDSNGTFIQLNEKLAAILGQAPIDLLGTTADPSLGALSPDDVTAESDLNLERADGSVVSVIAAARVLPSGDRLITVSDLSRQKNSEHAMKEQYELILQMSDTLLQQALELKRYSKTLEQRVRERTAQLEAAHMDAIYMLAVASEAKDADTGRHVRRIEHLARNLAKHMGISDSDSQAIGYSAILHDVGKMHVPDAILRKPGPLDSREREKMQEHTLAGERILAANSFFDRARRIARFHHENWDGSGYPDHLSGEEIPLDARIVHLADVFDALTHQRVYKNAWSADDAIRAIHEASGRMFDPAVVGAFDAAISDGSVELASPPLD